MGSTIRISQKDRLKLETLSRALGKKSLTKTFSEIIHFVDKRREEFLMSRREKQEEEPLLKLLENAGDFGRTDARRVDEYLYGEK